MNFRNVVCRQKEIFVDNWLFFYLVFLFFCALYQHSKSFFRDYWWRVALPLVNGCWAVRNISHWTKNKINDITIESNYKCHPLEAFTCMCVGASPCENGLVRAYQFAGRWMIPTKYYCYRLCCLTCWKNIWTCLYRVLFIVLSFRNWDSSCTLYIYINTHAHLQWWSVLEYSRLGSMTGIDKCSAALSFDCLSLIKFPSNIERTHRITCFAKKPIYKGRQFTFLHKV